MRVLAWSGELTQFSGDVLAIGRSDGAAPSPAEKKLDAALVALAAAADRLRFKGKARQRVTVSATNKLGAQLVVLIGLGKESACGPAILRDFPALAIETALPNATPQGFVPPVEGVDAVEHRPRRTPAHTDIMISCPSPRMVPRAAIEVASILTADDATDALKRADGLAEAVCWAVHSINEPPISAPSAPRGRGARHRESARVRDHGVGSPRDRVHGTRRYRGGQSWSRNPPASFT